MPRPTRTLPRDRVDDWPDKRADDPSAEVARRLAVNLRAALGDRSLRAAAEECGVNHTTIVAVLQGRSWPDLETIAKLERGLAAELWPHVSGAADHGR